MTTFVLDKRAEESRRECRRVNKSLKVLDFVLDAKAGKMSVRTESEKREHVKSGNDVTLLCVFNMIMKNATIKMDVLNSI